MLKIADMSQYIKKSLSLALVCAFLIGLAPVGAEKAAAADDTGKYAFISSDESAEDAAHNVMTLYKWTRVHKQSDLPKEKDGKVPVLILWPDAGTNYFISGKSGGGSCNGWDAVEGTALPNNSFFPDPFSASSDDDIFYTTEAMTAVTMKMTGGQDGDNQKAYQARFWFDGQIITGWDDWDWDGYKDSADHDKWSIHTKEIGGKYAGNINDKYPVKIYCNVKGSDTGFMHSGSKAYGYCDGTYDYHCFAMYWGQKITVSAITAPYTIGEGMVMNVDSGVILKEGVTLTILPGGVLSVEGQFYMNGTIENYGTIILQPGACITSFLPKSSGAGYIHCSGNMVNIQESLKQQVESKEAEIKALQTDISSKQTIRETAQREINSLNAQIAAKLKEQDATRVTLETRLRQLRDALDAANDRLGILTNEYLTKNGVEPDLSTLKGENDAGTTSPAPDDAELTAIYDYYRTTVAVRMKEYNEANAEIAELESNRGEQQLILDNADESIAENETLLAHYQRQLAELSEMSKRSDRVKVRGEGNLVVMEDARLVFNNTTDSRLVIEDGGSLVCNGYIIHPSAIVLSDAKIHIREKGAILGQYTLAKKILNARHLTPSGVGTTSVGFDGLEASNAASNCIMAAGNYMVKVDGVLRYAKGPVYNVTRGEVASIVQGSGKWTTDGQPDRFTDSQGNLVITDIFGNKTITSPDGLMTYYDSKTGVTTVVGPDGYRKVIQKNGTAGETRPDGSFINYLADGTIKDMSIPYNGSTLTYAKQTIVDDSGESTDFNKKVNMIRQEYETPKDGLKVAWYFDSDKLTSRDDVLAIVEAQHKREEHDVDGTCRRYDAAGELEYTIKRDAPDYESITDNIFEEGNFSYSDYEMTVFDDTFYNIEYVSGEYKGAKIKMHFESGELPLQYTPYFYLWEVTAANGEKTVAYMKTLYTDTNRSFEKMEYTMYILFEDGRTCTIPFGLIGDRDFVDMVERAANPKYFIGGSNLDMAPPSLHYDTVPEPLPIIEEEPYDFKKWPSTTTFHYRMTDGTDATYVNSNINLRMYPEDAVLERVDAPHSIVYFKKNYSKQKDSFWWNNKLLWEVAEVDNSGYLTGNILYSGYSNEWSKLDEQLIIVKDADDNVIDDKDAHYSKYMRYD